MDVQTLIARAVKIREQIEAVDATSSEETECCFYERGAMSALIGMLEAGDAGPQSQKAALWMIENNEEWLKRREEEDA
jgi:hypothetical protein